MDRSWMSLENRDCRIYKDGVQGFIDFAILHADEDQMIVCPCVRCGCNRRFVPEVVNAHLLCNGFDRGYTKWTYHGENEKNTAYQFSSAQSEGVNEFEGDTIDKMTQHLEQEAFDCPEMFEKLIANSEKPLYNGCKSFTRLSSIMKLYNLKAANGWSDKSFTDLLTIVHEMLPQDNVLPSRTYEAKKVLASIGMSYEKIHACPNDCILYRKEYSSLISCPTCKASRYKRDKIPIKYIWYFHVITRFRRLFSNPEDAKNLTWHADTLKSDGLLKHPADSPQWAAIDHKYPEFGSESRNLRLALSADGMNPHKSGTHSTWPVLLTIYNLPPQLCMKRKYILLSLLISGPNQPGNDIDVYLAPLIDDLKILWDSGVTIFDSFRQEHFNLKAMLFCTINDFPAYGNLSGYSVKGHTACPICMDDTSYKQLKHCKKTAYLGHRRFLPLEHGFRRKKKAFDGSIESRKAPKPLSGRQVFNKVKHLNVTHGKTNKNVPTSGFKKKSIFFELPYWPDLYVRHCLDVMHIEKNICESLVGTLLNIPWKTKDGLNARLDYVEMGIREKLHPQEKSNGRVWLPAACYTLSKEERIEFCQFLKGLKVPEGFSSNISNCVSMSDLKLLGLKSHDCHVLLHYFLPVAIRNMLPKNVRHAIIRLCLCFRKLCSKVVDPNNLDALQDEIVKTLCELEMYFPPSFFDIMVHLCVHLVREVKLCGPVYLRWMYPFERFMKILKGYVKNMYRPEGCIAESYLVEEAIEFCTAYLSNAEAIGIPKSRHFGRIHGLGMMGAEVLSISRILIEKAHLYVLFNSAIAEPYVNEHKELLLSLYPSNNEKWLLDEHNKTFPDWFKKKILVLKQESSESVSDDLLWLSQGPNLQVMSFSSYAINGYTFYTKTQDDKSVQQNSGVTLVADALHISSARDKRPVYAPTVYYGVISSIWELDYTKFTVPVFRCKWVDSSRGVKKDVLGYTSVDLAKEGHKQDPFILASQAQQVFYCQDTVDKKYSVVMPTRNRTDDLFLEESVVLPNVISLAPDFDENIPNEEEICIRDDHNDGEWVELGNKRKSKKQRTTK